MTDIDWESLRNISPRSAYSILADRYGNYVYAIVLRNIGRIGTNEDIEDCVSDIFVELLSNAESYSSSKGSVRSYIGTIASRRSVDTFRRLARNAERLAESDSDINELIESVDRTDDAAETKIMSERLRESIARLNSRDREIIVRQYYFGQPTAEIAQALSMSTDAVQKRSVRARRKLHKMLEGG